MGPTSAILLTGASTGVPPGYGNQGGGLMGRRGGEGGDGVSF